MGARRFNQQPQQPTRVDRSNPLSRALGLYAVAGQPESCQGLLPVLSGGFSFAYGPGRRAAWGPATQIAGYVAYDLASPIIINDDYTIAMVVSATQTYSTPIATHITEGTGVGNEIGIASDGCYVLLDGNSSGFVAYDFTKPVALVTRRTVNSATLHLNGVLVATWVTGQRTGQFTGFTFGRNRIGNANPQQTMGYMVAIAARSWSALEITSFTANPYQLSKGLAESDDYAPVTGIAFDAASSSGDRLATSYTFTRTVAGANRFLGIDVALMGTTGTSVTSITDDSTGTPVPLVRIGKQINGTKMIESWALTNPVVGTKTVSVVISAAVNSNAMAVSYTGVNQFVSTEAWNSANGTNAGVGTDASLVITSVADQCWMHAAICTDVTPAAANQTQRNNVAGIAGTSANSDSNGPKTPPGAVTMSYSGIGMFSVWTMSGYAIRPVAASNGTPVTMDGRVSSDWSTLRSADGVAPVSFYSPVTRNDVAPIDMTAATRADGFVPISFYPTVRADSTAPVNWSAPISADMRANIDWMTGALADGRVPVELRATLIADAPSPIEWAGGVIATMDGRMPCDWIAPVVRNDAAPVEWAGTVLATMDGRMPLDWSLQLAVDARDVAEWGAAVRGDARAPSDMLASARYDGVVPFDWSGAVSVTADMRAPVEWSGGISVTMNGVATAEWLSTARRDDAAPVTWSAALLADGVVPMAFERGLVADQRAAVEWLRTVFGDAVIPGATLVVMQADSRVPIEFGGASAFRVGNTEVFTVDARGYVWHVDARSTIWHIPPR